MENMRIDKGAVVAAGAVVTRDVEPHTVVAGVPARLIRKIDASTSVTEKMTIYFAKAKVS